MTNNINLINKINFILNTKHVYYIINVDQLFVGNTQEFSNIQLRHKQLLGFYLNFEYLGEL